MNAHVGIDGLTALRRINPDDAALGAALCMLLRASGMTVRPVAAPAHDAMFMTQGGLGFVIDSINGQTPQLSPSRLTETVAALDVSDPLLVDVEAALGLSLDATDMGQSATIAVGIHVARDDIGLTLAVPRNHANRADWIARAATMTPSAPHLPVIVSLFISGPRLTVADTNDLSSGDLLLIAQSATATLQTAYSPAISGAFNFSTGQFMHSQTGAIMSDDTLATDFLVPLTIKLPDRMTSAASLADLVPGTTLPLGPLTEGMPVELRVADRLLARGELVQLGNRFAVLIEDRADINDAGAAAGDD